ncbi:hypothetical protein [Streptomyces sp. NPDC004376]
MARLQILQLPEVVVGSVSETPFVLVIDQAPRDENSAAFRDDLVNNKIADRLGARAVLVFEDTIDIPANEVPVGPDGPIRVRVEGDFAQFREQVQEEIAKAQAEMVDSLRRYQR